MSNCSNIVHPLCDVCVFRIDLVYNIVLLLLFFSCPFGRQCCLVRGYISSYYMSGFSYVYMLYLKFSVLVCFPQQFIMVESFVKCILFGVDKIYWNNIERHYID